MTNDAVIFDRDGRAGLVEPSENDLVRVRLPGGAAVELAPSLVSRDTDGGYQADISFESLGAQAAVTLEEVEEQLRVTTRSRTLGSVVARTVTDSREETVDADGWRETVEVDRVAVDRVVDSVEPIREEDGVTIIPVYEEVLVVHKQLVLREELRLTTRREPVPGPERVTLRRQHVEIDRLPPEDAGA